MSLVTRCTSCGTLFKVVADQLKISEGWVRCGQCATVFDAQANLVHNTPAASPTPVTIASVTHSAPSIAPALTQEEAQAYEPIPESVALSISPAQESQPDTPSDIASEIQSFKESKLQDGATLGAFAYVPSNQSQPPNPVPGSLPSSAREDEPLEVVSRSEEPTTFIPTSKLDSALSLPANELSESAALGADTVTPSFVKQAQLAQRWRSPWMRLGLSLVCLMLSAVLILQIAWNDKDHIAAQWPQTKPWLEKLCKQADCQVQDLKRIESIAVDASSFNRINKNNPQLEAITQSYRLAVTLKNTGMLPVAMPHVELSLQDQQDQPILRRVLSPTDLGSNLTTLAPTQDMAGSLTVQIDTAQLAGSKIQGYRVLAFYP